MQVRPQHATVSSNTSTQDTGEEDRNNQVGTSSHHSAGALDGAVKSKQQVDGGSWGRDPNAENEAHGVFVQKICAIKCVSWSIEVNVSNLQTSTKKNTINAHISTNHI